jgi:hypothetical protein
MGISFIFDPLLTVMPNKSGQGVDAHHADKGSGGGILDVALAHCPILWATVGLDYPDFGAGLDTL